MVESTIHGFRSGFDISVREGWIDAYFGSSNPENIGRLRSIQRDYAAALEKEVGEKMYWTENGDSKHFWICAWMDSNPRDETDWPRQHEWLRVTLVKLIAAVSKRLTSSQQK